MAVFTGRMFMLRPYNTVNKYIDFSWDVDWLPHLHHYANVSSCDVDFSKLAQPNGLWCKGTHAAAVIMTYMSDDYELPLLQTNPAYQETLSRLFPAGDIFHQVAIQLFSMNHVVQQAAAPYADLAGQCLVGMHIRTKKPQIANDRVLSEVCQQYAGVASGLAQQLPGTIFVAADTDIFKNISMLLPGRSVWWSNLTQSSVGDNLAASGNPGTDISAMVDLHLLAQCSSIIVTAGSTFGPVAAAMANVVPVYAILGAHSDAFHSPWFWKALSSEPFFYKARIMQKKHPLALQFEQAHP